MHPTPIRGFEITKFPARLHYTTSGEEGERTVAPRVAPGYGGDPYAPNSSYFPTSYVNHEVVFETKDFAIWKLQGVQPQPKRVGYLLVRLWRNFALPIQFMKPGMLWGLCIRDMKADIKAREEAESSNENVLEGWECPRCGNHDSFDAVVSAVCSLSDDGTEDFRNVDWESDAPAYCGACDFAGTVGEFQKE